MKRREFLKALGALGVTTIAPDLFSDSSFIRSADASPVISSATVSVPAVTPQVINIFLYGGASELAGNLTNISDLNLQSQSKYTELNANFLNAYDPVNATPGELAQGRVGQLTPNAFWAHAGGIIMEDMLLDGDMSIYRTCYRKKNNTRAHRPSIFSTQKGTLDIDSAPGIGTTLASVISENRSAYETSFGKSLEDLVMPMVSFQGEATIFAPDPNAATPIPLSLKSVGLSANFDNPYQRTASTDPSPTKETLNALVDARMKAEPDIAESDLLTPAYGQRYKKVSESFLNHRKLATLVGSFRTILNDPNSLPLLPEGDPDGANPDFNSVLFNAYQQAILGVGRNFEHSTTFPEDPLYVAPAALSPQGDGLDNIWVDITTTVDNVTTTVKESRFMAFDGTTILNPDTDPRINGIPGQANRLIYPANNNFGNLLKAAVTLALHNVDSKFIMVGSPGLGGWDDHNSAMMSYEARMQTLMSAVRAAIKHVKYSFDAPFVADAPIDGGRGGLSTDNIIFNITTDFGRNANLNNSKGWDHGNNQNFYTFGGRPYVRDTNYTLEDGSAPPAAETPVTTVDKFYPEGDAATLVPAVRVAGALGKIIGTTNIFGTPGQNRWFTKPSHPTDDAIYNQDAPQIPSYEFEPQAVASTIYSWFGVENPEVLTQNHDDDFSSGTIQRYGTDGNGTLDASESAVSTAAGEPAIDESLASVHVNIRLPVKNIVT